MTASKANTQKSPGPENPSLNSYPEGTVTQNLRVDIYSGFIHESRSLEITHMLFSLGTDK